MFGDMVCDVNHPMNKHPEDFRLYRIGGFDDSNGRFEEGGMPELIASGRNFVGETGEGLGPRAVRG